MAGNTNVIASDILNRVAAEVGMQPVAAPLESQDPFFVQLRYLLNTAGEELMQAFPWEQLVRSYTILTQAGDTGAYALPDDFGHITNQTAWDNTNRIQLGGPLSASEWTRLRGRDLASSTIYTSFRIAQNRFNVYPTPPSAGTDLSFEYITINWVLDEATDPTRPVYKSEVTLPSDKPLFDKTLITRALKVKYLEAGGFDTTKAQDDYNQIFKFLTGTDKGAPVLNVGRGRGSFPYLSMNNVGDTGYGL